MEEISDTLAEKLASRDPTGTRFEAAWQAVVGKGADFWNQLERFLEKTVGWSISNQV
jgi:hypothetical protein